MTMQTLRRTSYPMTSLTRKLSIDLSIADVETENAIEDDSTMLMSSSEPDTNRVQVLRKTMVHRIQQVLYRLSVASSTSSNFSSTSCDVWHAAKLLEAELFRSAGSVKEYSNVHTLEDRLRSIVSIRLCQRALRGASSYTIKGGQENHKKIVKITPKSHRNQVLRKILGGAEKYQRVQSLVKEIQQAKLQRVAVHCGQNSGCWTRSVVTSCGTEPSRDMKSSSSSSSTHQRFPPAVRNLFFHTPLVQAFLRTPVEMLYTLNWNQLIEQAHQHLIAFHN